MSETDEEFWQDLYEEYVAPWIDEDFKEDDEKGFQTRQDLVEGEGEGKNNLHNSIFNRINEAAQKPSNQGIGYFRNVRRHGMVMNKNKFAKIAQEKLQDSVGKEEVKRLGKSFVEKKEAKSKLRAIREVRVVSEKGRKEFERLESDFLRESGKVTTFFFRELGRASNKNEVADIIGRAERELEGENLEAIREAAETRREEV